LNKHAPRRIIPPPTKKAITAPTLPALITQKPDITTQPHPIIAPKESAKTSLKLMILDNFP